MLSIRMQRTGRKGYATYRVVVQDSRRAPTSGNYVALLGNYNPHTKVANIEKDKAELFLKNGAQPTDRVVRLFKEEKITLPSWVKDISEKKKSLRNPEKLRKNQPDQPVEETPQQQTDEPAASEETNETTEATENADVAEAEAPESEETTQTPPASEAEEAQENVENSEQEAENSDDQTKNA